MSSGLCSIGNLSCRSPSCAQVEHILDQFRKLVRAVDDGIDIVVTDWAGNSPAKPACIISAKPTIDVSGVRNFIAHVRDESRS